MSALSTIAVAVWEAGSKIGNAVREITRRTGGTETWMQRVILREIRTRTSTRGKDYWDSLFPGLPARERAQQRIRRMLTRATVAGVLAAAGASAAEVLTLVSDWSTLPIAIPLGLVAVGAEMLYTTAIQIDLVFDLASIYDVPFADNDVGEISTLLAMALGVQLVGEPTRHDKPDAIGETKPWRILRQMQRSDFAGQIGKALMQQSFLRNTVPVAGILVSALWNQITLRRFASQVHTSIRQRVAIVSACSSVEVGDPHLARRILDGAYLIATADGDIGHQEALALATLIDSLSLPDRTPIHEASFTDDEEQWFADLESFPPSAHDLLIRVAVIIASVDGNLSTAERRFMQRLGEALHREIDLTALENIVEGMRAGKRDPFDGHQVVLQPA